MTIKILGTGCPKCKTLESKVREVVAQHNISCEVEKVTELSKIMNYGVMMTPALVINEQVKSMGDIPGETQILKWLQEA